MVKNMLEELKEKVCAANLDLVKKGVVIYTWGNVSGISEDRKYVVIKPSGVDYATMQPQDMVVVDLQTGDAAEGRWKPSSDTATHLELYRKYKNIGGVVHTHSCNAVAFAQAAKPIPALGTTHADTFYGNIPCTRRLTEKEVEKDYEKNTGKVITETVERGGYDPLSIPGILVCNHGPFAWGKDCFEAVHNAVVLEKTAEMALKTLLLNPSANLDKYVLDKHYFRKHGANAYYGQTEERKKI